MKPTADVGLTVSQDGFVKILRLDNGPEGVLDGALVEAIHRALDQLEQGAETRVLVIQGSVPGVFVRRYDVDEFFAPDSAASAAKLAALPALVRRLEALPIPTVAALNGTTLGGGLELALGCDFRLACDGPFRLGMRETDVGLLPGAGGAQRLARSLGMARAMELILLGRLLKPAEALAVGLVHQVYEREAFAAHTRRFCQELARRAPRAMSLAKQVIRAGLELPFDEALRLEHQAFEASRRSVDAREAVAAYAEGRAYDFRGQ